MIFEEKVSLWGEDIEARISALERALELTIDALGSLAHQHGSDSLDDTSSSAAQLLAALRMLGINDKNVSVDSKDAP